MNKLNLLLIPVMMGGVLWFSSCASSDYKDLGFLTVTKEDGDELYYERHYEVLFQNDIIVKYKENANSQCYKKTGVQFYIKVETKKVKNGDVVPLSTGHNLKGETTYHFSTGDKEHIDYTVVDNYYVTYKFSEKKRTLKIKKSNGKTETVTFGDTDVFTPVYLQ